MRLAPWNRIWFTIGALLVYRLGTYIPLPGIDPSAVEQALGAQGGILGAFSGGGIHRLSLLGLSIIPYISAAVFVQVAMIISPALWRRQNAGEYGRRALDRYTMGLTVLLAASQGLGLALGLEGIGYIVSEPGALFRVSTVLTLSGGTVFLVWLSEQITARGVGNGLALIVAAGIVADLPAAVAGTIELHRQGALSTGQVVVLPVLAVVVIAFVVFIERARRHLSIEYSERQVGNRMLAGRSAHLPLKLNMAGVIPVIFAAWLLGVLAAAVSLIAGPGSEWPRLISAQLGPGRPLFLVLNFGLILLLAFFYTAFVFNPTEAADNLKRHGGFIPSIEPGERTAEHIDWVLSRLTMVGAIYLALVCLIPEILVSYANVPFYLGGMSLMIMVCTIIDIDAQIRQEARLKLGGYQR
ncbi:MAG: preprotein translocase subunit SecY [Xanthobacteraceae bacterium]